MSEKIDREASLFAAHILKEVASGSGKPLEEGDVVSITLNVDQIAHPHLEVDHTGAVKVSFAEWHKWVKNIDFVFDARRHEIATKNVPSVDEGVPPALAEAVLVLLIDKRRSDALLGDLEERFHRDRMTRGLRHARLLYWSRALASIRPLLWPAMKRLFTFVVGVVVGRTSG